MPIFQAQEREGSKGGASDIKAKGERAERRNGSDRKMGKAAVGKDGR